MSVVVAVTDSAEGQNALEAAYAEAQRLGTDLVVVNLRLSALDVSEAPEGLRLEVVDRRARRGTAEAVLDALAERAGSVERLVIGVRRRSPVGKAVLGSLSQELLMEADVPILAVKLPRPARSGKDGEAGQDVQHAAGPAGAHS
ncbi:universal stress protein [Kineococcus esterisolvens]|uniref:universal stress protein n=1 Tax=unclassified Kineococcus TaxID=2621656 RepID=UPI003D7D1E26